MRNLAGMEKQKALFKITGTAAALADFSQWCAENSILIKQTDFWGDDYHQCLAQRSDMSPYEQGEAVCLVAGGVWLEAIIVFALPDKLAEATDFHCWL